MKTGSPQCAKCPVTRCRTRDVEKKLPDFCPTKNYPDIASDTIGQNLNNKEVRAINLAWKKLMDKVSQNRWSWTRVEEVMEYARIRGYKKLGVASCVGLLHEARLLTNLLENNDFEVASICCLAGEVKPADVNIGEAPVFCNPLMQAEILNREKTELNIMLGLCVGHDILFIRHSRADVTPLVVKDRALGHNPVAALYLSESYYKERFKKK